MVKLPIRLSRRAVKSIFIKIKPETWDYIFDYEKLNGLQKHRVKGPNSHAFYNSTGVMLWLVEMGYYTPAELSAPEKISNNWSGLVVRTHALAG